jgi:hypothetical protein
MVARNLTIGNRLAVRMAAIALLLFVFTATYGQRHRITSYFRLQYAQTLSDLTLGNNPWGIGLGLQAFYNNRSRFRPSLELTSDLYLEDDKVQRLSADGLPLQSIPTVTNLFAGSAFRITQSFYLSFLMGPSFINGQTLLGIKPSVAFFLCRNQRWLADFSYIRIFNREEKKDFVSISGSIGLRMF